MVVEGVVESAASGLSSGVSSTVASIVERLGSSIVGTTRAAIGKAQIRFKLGFEKYLNDTIIRCSTVKTLIHRHDPVTIDSAYVAVDLSSQNRKINASDLIDLTQSCKHATISGIAGCGKSMTLKYLYLFACRSTTASIPMFVELRNIDFSNESIESHMVQNLAPFVSGFQMEAIDYGLKSGLFFLMLDGFDEIPRESRKKAEKNILKIVHDFPLCRVLVTSRPDSRLETWTTFVNFRVDPLSKDQVIKLVERIEYDRSTCDRFVQRIQSGLYESHRTLLSNPLLATMMLLTFDEYAEIPSKMHIFYRQAFEVLYSKHDRFKPQFVRKYSSGLQYDALERHVSTFAFVSQLDGVITFDEALLQRYSARALEYEDSGVSTEDFCSDVLDNLCLLIRDGDKYSFIHRSFQEYFSALFLATRAVPQFIKAVDHFVDCHTGERVAHMMYEVNPELVERNYVLPKLKSMLESFSECKNSVSKAKLVFSGFVARENDSSEKGVTFSFSITNGDKWAARWAGLYFLLSRHYPQLLLHKFFLKFDLDALVRTLDKDNNGRAFKRGDTLRLEKLTVREFKELGGHESMRLFEKELRSVYAAMEKRCGSRATLLSDALLRK